MTLTRCVAALAIAGALAACTTDSTIDGHQVRGTAAPETPVEQAAREFNEHVGEIIAPIAKDVPQVQAALRKLRAERAASEDPGNLHRHAPGWMHQKWAEYLDLAAGNYAVLALDRNGYGVGIVYCVGGGCSGPLTSGGRSWREVNYKHGALENCRESVRDNHPTERPDCAIYAIKDKIVWEGRMPWE